MDITECTKEKLWQILVETAHALVLYANHKVYTRGVILPEKPETTPADLAARLRIPLGEALVIMHELGEEREVRT